MKMIWRTQNAMTVRTNTPHARQAPRSATERNIRSSRAIGRAFYRAALAMAVAFAVVFVWSGSAQAIYLDFADYQGSESGNRANIEVDGTSITISSRPTRFDLTISNSGLGVGCTDGFWGCLSNSRSQIDAEWNEQITITFNDGPVSLERVVLSRLYSGEVAVVGTEAVDNTVEGSGWRRRTSTVAVDMGGALVSEITVSARGWFSDMSVRGLVFNRPGSLDSLPRPQPTSAIPEPTAALLFVAGLGVAASKRRR